jgi:hypothetical protein
MTQKDLRIMYDNESGSSPFTPNFDLPFISDSEIRMYIEHLENKLIKAWETIAISLNKDTQ